MLALKYYLEFDLKATREMTQLPDKGHRQSKTVLKMEIVDLPEKTLMGFFPLWGQFLTFFLDFFLVIFPGTRTLQL